MDSNVVEKIKSEIGYLTFLSSHDYYHLIRVYNNVVMLCSVENLPKDVATTSMLAALLHDVGHKKVSYTSRNEHEQESANIAKELLAKHGLLQEDIENVLNCIRNHRVSVHVDSDSMAIRVLQDADRLDALGAIAIARTFSYDSNRPIYLPSEPPKDTYDGISLSSINHIIEKVLKLMPDTFNTALAQKIARKRLIYVQGFVDEFIKEWNGER